MTTQMHTWSRTDIPFGMFELIFSITLPNEHGWIRCINFQKPSPISLHLFDQPGRISFFLNASFFFSSIFRQNARHYARHFYFLSLLWFNSFLLFILLNKPLIAMVIPIQITKNGVPGPAQNNQQALPTLNIDILNGSLFQAMKPIIYGIHTSLETTKKTITKIKAVLQSLIFTHIHTQGNATKNHTHFQNLLNLLGSKRICVFHTNWSFLNLSST